MKSQQEGKNSGYDFQDDTAKGALPPKTVVPYDGMQRNPNRKLKDNIISWVSLIVIFLSAFGMLKTILDVPSTQSASMKTGPSTVASNSSILLASPTPRAQFALGAAQSASAAGVPSTNILLASPTPRAERTPGSARSAPAVSATIAATSTPGILAPSPTPAVETTPNTKATAAASVPTSANSIPRSLPAFSTPEQEATPGRTEPPSATIVAPTPAPKPLRSRVVRHQPNQFRQGALSKEELAALKKAIRTIKWSRNSDPKAAADEDYAAIVKECRNSRLHALLADLITEAAGSGYRSDNEAANAAYINQLISNFERAAEPGREGPSTSPQHP
jgi:hypothetical protein